VFVVFGYLPLFGIAIASREMQFPWWGRLAAASGFLVTLGFVLLSIFPIVDVGSRVAYAAKIAGVIGVANLLGAALYWRTVSPLRDVSRLK